MSSSSLAHTTPPSHNVFIGRQPIFDRSLSVNAYELLNRSSDGLNPAAARLSGDQATSATIVNTFVSIGLDKLVRDKYAAMNLTEGFFLETSKLPFTPKQVILEFLEDIPVTPQLVMAVKRLTEMGYIIAPLPLSEEVVGALLYWRGRMGEALSCAMAYEIADWNNTQFADLSTEQILVANIEAVTWANGNMEMT